MIKKSYNKSYSLLAFAIFFFLFSFYIASAVSITQLQTGTLSQARGTAGLVFDSTGNKLFAFDNWHGSNPNYISEYALPTAYDISALAHAQSINLSSYLPSPFNTALYSLTTGYITRNGNNLYIIMGNVSDDQNDANIHYNNYTVFHFTLNNFDLSTLTLADSGNIGQIQGFFNVNPTLMGIYVNDNGSLMTLTGRSTIAGNSAPRFFFYNLVNPYAVNLTTAGASPYNITIGSYSSYASYTNLWVAPNNGFLAFLERDIKQGAYSTKFALVNGNVVELEAQNREGLTLASTFSNIYLFSQSGGTIYKYQLDNYTAIVSETLAVSEGQSIFTQVTDSIINIFPPSTTLTFKQKTGIVFIVMLLTTLIILFAGSQLGSQGLSQLILWIIMVLLVSEFIFFVAISYIPLGFFITLLLVALGLSYFKLKGNGG